MKQCAVIIGVDMPGNMPSLNCAAENALTFSRWARQQHFDVITLTDDSQIVTLADVQAAVSSFVEQRCYQKMVIYFSGHGVLKGPEHEIWLLSNASKTNSAVNLTGSILLSRNVGIEHVIFISDACRSIPASITLMQVVGGEVFESFSPTRLRPVIDIFYATLPGDPAYEVPENTAIKRYKSLFTDNLLAGLNGSVGQVIKEHDNQACVPSWEMRRYLDVEVPRQIAEVAPDLIQIPDIRVESHFPPSYLSVIDKINFGEAESDRKKGEVVPNPNEFKPSSPKATRFPFDRVIQSMVDKISGTKAESAPDPYYYGIRKESVGYYKSMIYQLYYIDDELRRWYGRDASRRDSILDDDRLINANVSIFDILQRNHSRNQALLKYVETMFDGLSISTEYKGESSPEGDSRNTFFFITNYPSQYDIISQDNAEISKFKNGFSVGDLDYVLIVFSFGAVLLPKIQMYDCEIIIRQNRVYSINYFPSKSNQNYHWYRRQLESINYIRSLMLTNSWSGICSPFSGFSDRGIFLEKFSIFSSTIAILNEYNRLKSSDLGPINMYRESFRYELYEHFRDICDFSLINRDTNLENGIAQCPIFNQGWAVIRAMSVRLPEPILEASRYTLPGLFTVFSGKGVDILRKYIKMK